MTLIKADVVNDSELTFGARPHAYPPQSARKRRKPCSSRVFMWCAVRVSNPGPADSKSRGLADARDFAFVLVATRFRVPSALDERSEFRSYLVRIRRICADSMRRRAWLTGRRSRGARACDIGTSGPELSPRGLSRLSHRGSHPQNRSRRQMADLRYREYRGTQCCNMSSVQLLAAGISMIPRATQTSTCCTGRFATDSSATAPRLMRERVRLPAPRACGTAGQPGSDNRVEFLRFIKLRPHSGT